MRDALRPDAVHGLDTTRFWGACMRRSVAGRELAAIAGVDPETAFTACLLQDIGLLALQYAQAESASLRWWVKAARGRPPACRRRAAARAGRLRRPRGLVRRRPPSPEGLIASCAA